LHYLGAPSTSPCPKVQNSLKYLPSLKKLKWQKSLQLSQLLLMHPTPRFKIGSNVFQAFKKNTQMAEFSSTLPAPPNALFQGIELVG
jgi:hypothetical protein